MVAIEELLTDVSTDCVGCGAHLPRPDHFFRLENHGWTVYSKATAKVIQFACPKCSLDFDMEQVIAGEERAHRTQLRGGRDGGVERIEAGVGRAEHSDPARAPGLVGAPRDGAGEIVHLGGRILVDRDSVR